MNKAIQCPRCNFYNFRYAPALLTALRIGQEYNTFTADILQRELGCSRTRATGILKKLISYGVVEIVKRQSLATKSNGGYVYVYRLKQEYKMGEYLEMTRNHSFIG